VNEPVMVRRAVVADVAGIVALLRDVAAEDAWIRAEVPVDIAGRELRLSAAIAAGSVALALLDARLRGVQTVGLEVYTHNTVAIALYRSLGFARCGQARFDERPGGVRWELLPMACDLRA
jgi:L-amino acid N-acyltransferase YncA